MTEIIDFRKLKLRTAKRFGDSPFESFELDVSDGQGVWKTQVAVVDYHIRDDGIAVIEDINVAANYTGKGVGRFIIKRLETDLKHEGIHEVHLDRVQKEAMGFWRTLGYYPPSNGLGWRKPL